MMNANHKPYGKFRLSEDELRDLVVNQRMSDVAIGKQIGMTGVSVMYWRQKFGIEQPFERVAAKPIVNKRKPMLSREALEELYVTNGLSQRQIGEQYGVSQACVGLWLSRYGIVCAYDPGSRRINLDKEELRRMYLDEERSMEYITNALGCPESTVRQNLLRYGMALTREQVVERQIKRNESRYSRSYVADYRYLKIPSHPEADQRGYVAEHRVAAEESIGRVIGHNEQVHHINFRKLDNRVENLAVLPDRATHSNVHTYMERIGAFLLGLSDIRPEALDFSKPVFWGGEWVTSIDLIARRDAAMAGGGKKFEDLTERVLAAGGAFETVN